MKDVDTFGLLVNYCITARYLSNRAHALQLQQLTTPLYYHTNFEKPSIRLPMSNKSSASILLATVTAVAAAATTAYAFSSKQQNGITHTSHHFNVPPEILKSDCQCKQELILALRLALEGERIV